MLMIPKPYFRGIPGIEHLDFYYSFYELERPILFLCKDSKGQMFLCSCCELYPKLMWIISNINAETLRRMMDNEISLVQAFTMGELKFVACWERGDPVERIKAIDSFDASMLPDADEFLDEEDGEFDDLRNQMRNTLITESGNYQFSLMGSWERESLDTFVHFGAGLKDDNQYDPHICKEEESKRKDSLNANTSSAQLDKLSVAA